MKKKKKENKNKKKKKKKKKKQKEIMMRFTEIMSECEDSLASPAGLLLAIGWHRLQATESETGSEFGRSFVRAR